MLNISIDRSLFAAFPRDATKSPNEEGSMKIELEFEDAALEGLASSIKTQLTADPAKREALAQFAMSQVVAWMCGRTSYQSMTEQQTDWLLKLLPIFYADEVPSAERIFNNFSVPYGRAAYISRVLLEKQHTAWRIKGRQKLRAALKAKNDEADKNNKKGDGLKYVPVSLDNLAYRELSVILEDVFKDDDALSPPVNKAQSPGRRTLDVPSQLFPELLKRLET